MLADLKPELVRGQLMDLHERGVPALVTWGADDRMGDETCAMGHYAEVTGAEPLRMENAGHCLFADHPDLFFDAFNTFLRAL
jgi:pimeloyl-ACP methyl ester carboxylesterase